MTPPFAVRSTLLVLPLVLLPLAACGPGPSQRSAHARAAAIEQEWTWLQQAKKNVDAKREQLEAAAVAENPDPKALAALRAQVGREGGELQRRLVGFLNAQPPVEGEPLTPHQKEAIRMKSDEDILLGRAFIEQGGDFQRAIELYEAALGLDPGYERLQTELQEARARRYISREAFDEVKEGMTEDEVRQALGQPNLHNVKEYTEHGVVGWFYPKDETGAAAGIWFDKESGSLKVFKVDFDAIRPRGPAPGGPPIT
jgi:hypothetical protein